MPSEFPQNPAPSSTVIMEQGKEAHRKIQAIAMLAFSLFVSLCCGQDLPANKTRKHSIFRRDFLAPAILLSTGLLAATDNEVFDKWEINEARQYYFPHFKTTADNYLQYAPIAAAFALDAFKVKGTHRVLPKTMMLIKSELFMVVLTVPLKHLSAIPRPDTGAKNSFPSGHTAEAFAAATFFHKEYGYKHPLYSVGAYTLAASVGVMRILNNRHWASDVLVGAGLGILSTNLAYLTERKEKHARHMSLSHLRFIPQYAQRSAGFSLSCMID